MQKSYVSILALVAALGLSAPAFAQDATAGASAGADATVSAGTDGTAVSAGADANASASAGTDTSASDNTTTTSTDASASAGADASANVSASDGNLSIDIDTSVNVNVTVQQTVQIRQIIIQDEADTAPVSNVTFSIALGTVVPSSIVLRPLPAAVVAIVPQFEGYLYFVLDDGRIVIVSKDALKIVAIIRV